MGVREARRGDAAAVAEIQVRAWQSAYRGFMPAETLAALPEGVGRFREQWAEAAAAPARHRLLVAVAEGIVTGFAAYSPATDPDQDETAAELIALHVDPLRAREGHGSRLLAAAVDLLREDSYATVVTWVFTEDAALRGFLEPAGWAPDEATRTLELDEPVHMIRLHTNLSAEPAV
ncbi:GNAT family N-acetyltransferase [Actinocorallia longicatena]|uniref:GNAT family N-acetyltransferase n=1 Tax=Actinocorallia longicatena TaxID=111803 RepID=A0ABP6QRX8_9ACTN